MQAERITIPKTTTKRGCMLLLRKLVLQRHFISLFLSIGRNGIGSHVLRNTFRLAPTTVACVVHSGAQIIALCFSAQTHRLCFASNTDLIVPKAKHLCPLAPGVRKRLFLLPLPPEKRVQERVAAVAPPRHSGNTLLIHLEWRASGYLSFFFLHIHRIALRSATPVPAKAIP